MTEPRASTLSRRVVMVIRSAGTGGVETHVCQLVSFLRQQGHEPIIVSLASTPPHAQFEALGCPVEVLADTEGWSWRAAAAALALWRILRRLSPDLVHVHGARPILIGSLAARLAGCRTVVSSLHGSYALMAMRDDGTTPRLLEWFARVVHGTGFLLSTRIVVCAERLVPDVAACVRGVMLVAPAFVRRRIRVVHHGIDAEPFGPRAAATNDAAAPARFIAGTLSRLDEPKKGIAVLLEAIARASRRVPLTLLVAGQGHSKAALVRRAEALDLADCRFLGYVDDPAAFYRGLDCFVLPSLSEGMPLVNLEAMASGVAVITTDVGGAAEAVQDGRTGLVVPPGESEALADAIVRLAEDEALTRRLGEAGRARVQQHFTIGATCRKLLDVYDEAAAAAGGS